MISELTFSALLGLLFIVMGIAFGKKINNRELSGLEELCSVIFIATGISFLFPPVIIFLSYLRIL